MLNFSLLCKLCRFWISKKEPYPWHKDKQTDTYLNAVVALAPAIHQIKFNWAFKLGIEEG